MKNLIYILAIALFIASCGTDSTKETKKVENNLIKKAVPGENLTIYGESVTKEGAADAMRVPSLLTNTNEKNVKVIGKVVDVCQSSGCWIELDLGNNQVLHVTFKDEAFVVPKDLTGKTVLMDGTVSKEELSVNMLKKMAEEKGLSKSEIDKITEPGVEYSYEAIGVVVK